MSLLNKISNHFLLEISILLQLILLRVEYYKISSSTIQNSFFFNFRKSFIIPTIAARDLKSQYMHQLLWSIVLGAESESNYKAHNKNNQKIKKTHFIPYIGRSRFYYFRTSSFFHASSFSLLILIIIIQQKNLDCLKMQSKLFTMIWSCNRFLCVFFCSSVYWKISLKFISF